jgi:hypothetical protein
MARMIAEVRICPLKRLTMAERLENTKQEHPGFHIGIFCAYDIS